MNWISVKDQDPPKNGEPFICYDPSQIDNFPDACIYVVRFIGETYYQNSAYVEAGGECYYAWEPTHWMPRPKPPEEK